MSILDKINQSPKCQKALSSTITLFLLSLFVPFIFMVTINLHMFNVEQLCDAFIALLFVAIPLVLLARVLDLLKENVTNMLLVHFILLVFASLLGVVLFKFLIPLSVFFENRQFVYTIRIASIISFYFILKEHFYSRMSQYFIHFSAHYIKQFIIMLIALMAAFFVFHIFLPVNEWFFDVTYRMIFWIVVYISIAFIAFRFSLKPLNIFLLIFLCTSLVRLPFEVYTNYTFTSKSEQGGTSQIETMLANTSQKSLQVGLKHKPNIYVLFLESYMGIETLKEEYNFDTTELENKLYSSGFNIYENVFSNAPSSLASLWSLYTMQNAFYKLQPQAFKDVIGGSIENKLFAYLKQNGYYIKSYLDNPYYFNQKEAFLDELHYHSPTKVNLMYVFGSISSELREFLSSSLKRQKETKTLENIIIETNQEPKQPTFFLTVFAGELHGDWKFVQDFPTYPLWVHANDYPNKLHNVNNNIFAMIDFIEKNDPNALIVLLGDHGYRYSGFISYGNSSPSTLSAYEAAQAFPSLQMTPLQLGRDFFSTFLAVKMPKYLNQDISYDLNISHANLFRHIFATLSENNAFLEDRVENNSYINNPNGVLSIHEGKVVEPK